MEQGVTLTPEDQLFLIRLPCKLRGTWVTWKLGFNPYFLMSRETYYRHANELADKYGVEIRSNNYHITAKNHPNNTSK